jgi:TIR domain
MTDEPAQSQSYFLSYSRSDERIALRLANDLRAQGVAVWVDQLDIRPSEHWDRAIERAVRDCRGLVVILSPRSVASENVADEISYAIDGGKSVLPVMIEKCVLPLRITRMHVIDATGSYDKALQQCFAELTHPDRNAPRQPSPATRAQPLDPEILAAARRDLATIVGPIAGILVDKAAGRAASVKELHALLIQHIDSEADRERFAAITQQKPPSAHGTPQGVANAAISAAELDSIAGTLTKYLGPIAPLVAKRESRTCGSVDDLRHRLAALIPAQEDREDFLRRITAR